MNENILASRLYEMYRKSKLAGREDASQMKEWHEIAQPGEATEFLAWLNVAVYAKQLLGVSDKTDGEIDLTGNYPVGKRKRKIK